MKNIYAITYSLILGATLSTALSPYALHMSMKISTLDKGPIPAAPKTASLLGLGPKVKQSHHKSNLQVIILVSLQKNTKLEALILSQSLEVVEGSIFFLN